MRRVRGELARANLLVTAPKREFRFTPLREDDLGLIRTWLLRPHVKRWYDDVPAQTYPDDSLADYLRAIRGEDPTEHFLIAMDGRPVGMIQSYRVDDHPEYAAQVALGRPAIGIDLFIGEPELIGRGHGPALIRAFLRDVAFPRYHIELCVIGPTRGNASAIRAYEKAGFRFLKMYQEPGAREPEHYLMELTRAELDAGAM